MLNDVSLEPQDGQKALHAVIIVHGLGDSAAGIIGLGEAMRPTMPNTLFLAPDAPYPCEFSPFGFQWFPARDWTPAVVLAGVKQAAPELNAYIDHVIATRGLTPDKIALVGFSQGTIMNLYVGPRRTPSLAGLLGYSGALVGGETLRQERQSNPPIQLIHGTDDDVISFAAMDLAREGLQSANLNVETLACRGVGHSVDDEGLACGTRFLRKVLKV